MSEYNHFRKSVEYDLHNNKNFNSNYELASMIYSNNKYYLYSIKSKSTNKRYYLEVYRINLEKTQNSIDSWKTKDFKYFINEDNAL